jgi:hypothetical protein
MLKLVALVALFAAFCWFGTQVTLGSHTLFGHLHAIAGTKESQDLFDGTRESTKPLVDDVRRRIAGAAEPAAKSESASAGRPDAGAAARTTEAHRDKVQDRVKERVKDKGQDDDVTPSDRRRLRRLISSAEGASARP